MNIEQPWAWISGKCAPSLFICLNLLFPSSDTQKQFQKHLDSGLMEIISPPAEFYPDFTGLKQTLGDDMERVTWRSKQSLDFSFLMMYAKSRGTFYVQLEDDVLTKKVDTKNNYIEIYLFDAN